MGFLMTEAQKFDQNKLPMDLLDAEWLEGVAAILQFGAGKYAAHNWRKGMQWSRLYAAAQRHLSAFAKGEEMDSETGLSHLLHASCCLMFLHSMQKHRRDLNDLFWANADTSIPEAGQEGESNSNNLAELAALLAVLQELAGSEIHIGVIDLDSE